MFKQWIILSSFLGLWATAISASTQVSFPNDLKSDTPYPWTSISPNDAVCITNQTGTSITAQITVDKYDSHGGTNIDPITLHCGSTPAVTVNPGSATYCKTTANICWADQPVVPNYQWYYSHGTYEVSLSTEK